MGTILPDVQAGRDAIDPHEESDPADPDVQGMVRDLAIRSGYESHPMGSGWRVVVPIRTDRRQAVYVGPAGADKEGRIIFSLVSVCGPARDRDARRLLRLNARMVEGSFAIKMLRGEEYFVVVSNLAAAEVENVEASSLCRRIAEIADGLEDALSRGADVY